MIKVVLVIIPVIVGGVVYALTKPANTSHLEKEVKQTISAEYDKPFKVEAGTLIQFAKFDVFARGVVPLTPAQKFHNWTYSIRGIDGGYNTASYNFQIKAKDGKVLHELNMQTWPFSWKEFDVEGKTFTLKLQSGAGEGAMHILFEGDVNQKVHTIIRTTNMETLNLKIAPQHEVRLKSGDVEYIAPNKPDRPSLVIAKKGDTILWQMEMGNPDVGDLQLDVFDPGYFITVLETKPFESREALYVTRGEDITAVTYILNPKNGELLNMMIISPPPVQQAKYGQKVSYSLGDKILFPDFVLTYTGEEKIPGPNSAQWSITYYLFTISTAQGKNSQEISWSSGTGMITPVNFEFNNKKYTLEKAFSEKIGKLADDEIVINVYE